jgi:HSP20 family molecular chaperone IbpA
MARLPARSSGRNMTVIDPPREFEDIYDRMGQLVNVVLAELPWSPPAEVSETENAYVVAAELPGAHKDQISVELQESEVITGEATDQCRAGGTAALAGPGALSTAPCCPATSTPKGPSLSWATGR